MISKKSCFLFLAVILLFSAKVSFASGQNESLAPPATFIAENGIPALIPFRVWVVPSSNRGVVKAGHYEFFELADPKGYKGIALQSPSLEAVYPAVPLPTGARPAIPGN